MSDNKSIILASSSPYRKALLARLNLPFTCCSPDIDESPHIGETPEQLARRLSLQKAEAIYQHSSYALIIASDQVAVLNGQPLGKPGTMARAIEQLGNVSGNSVTFLTGLSLITPELAAPKLTIVPYTVHFRKLSSTEIERYINADQPLDCAGSFKWEQLGISLFERMEGDDPTALEGLPLITLSRWLRESGLMVP